MSCCLRLIYLLQRDSAWRKMKSLILLSLLAAVTAGKSPRLKFVVHGKKLLFLPLISCHGFISSQSEV